MDERRHTISVVCCTHNRELFARTHLESLRTHLGTDIELLYALDNCTDGTRAALESLAGGHTQIRILDHRGERGLFNCRNFGIAHARGDYIHFLDDDDSVEPGFYARACADLQQTDSAPIDIYLSRLQITTGDGQAGEREVVPPELLQQAKRIGDALLLQGDLFGPILQGRLYFNGANALYSVALLKRYGYRQELKKSADWLFILEAALRQPLRLVFNNQITANYYVHAASMSIGPDKAMWNARVFELLLRMAHHQPKWAAEIRHRCAKAQFDAGYALRTTDRGAARQLYWRTFQLQPRLRPLLALAKTCLAR